MGRLLLAGKRHYARGMKKGSVGIRAVHYKMKGPSLPQPHNVTLQGRASISEAFACPQLFSVRSHFVSCTRFQKPCNKPTSLPLRAR